MIGDVPFRYGFFIGLVAVIVITWVTVYVLATWSRERKFRRLEFYGRYQQWRNTKSSPE